LREVTGVLLSSSRPSVGESIWLILRIGASVNMRNRVRTVHGLGPSSWREQPERPSGGTRAELMKDPEFKAEFDQARKEMRDMDYRCVREDDSTKQAPLEICCAMVLRTKYNDFENPLRGAACAPSGSRCCHHCPWLDAAPVPQHWGLVDFYFELLCLDWWEIREKDKLPCVSNDAAVAAAP
jgi:hypothetical protein